MTSTIAAVSQNQSLAAIRNFVRASISCITFARGLCSDSSYETRPFLGMELNHMVPASTEAITMSEWIEKGAFDALNKNYLKEMALCVHNRDCTVLLESYCFGFTYTPDGQRACMTVNSTQQPASQTQEESSCGGGGGPLVTQPKMRKRRCTAEEVRDALSGILRHLLEVVEHLPPLVTERLVTMRLTYYDDVTPEGYQPPFFAAASRRMIKFYQDEQKNNVSIGSMDTSHHLFSVAVRHPLLAKVNDGILKEQLQKEQLRLRETGVTATLSAGTFPTDVSVSNSTWTVDESSAPAADTGRPAQPHKGPRRRKMAGDVTQDSFTPAAAQSNNSRASGAALRPEDLANFSSLVTLAGTSSPLRTTEVAYLLLVAFAIVRCAPSAGGRGRMTFADLQDYLKQSCALDIPPDAAAAAMRKLVTDGYLRNEQEDADNGAGAAHVRKSRRGVLSSASAAGPSAGAEAELGLAVWSMSSDPPPAVLAALLEQRQVTELLSPADHNVLAEIGRTMQRKAKLAEKQQQQQQQLSQTGDRRRAAPRMSCAESRKRRMDDIIGV